MMTNKLNDARKSLVRAKQAAEARLVELDSERRETKASIRSLDAAIRALRPGGKKPPTESTNPPTGGIDRGESNL